MKVTFELNLEDLTLLELTLQDAIREATEKHQNNLAATLSKLFSQLFENA